MMHYQTELQNIGLSAAEAKIYELLVTSGGLPASGVARKSGVERSLCYVVLGQLIEKELVSKDESKKVTRFIPTHPQKLQELVEAKKQASQSAESSLSAVFHQLQQSYEVLQGQPGVRFYSALDGLDYTYNDLKQGEIKEMMLIRTIDSSKDIAGYSERIKKQQELRIQKKIPMRVIAPSTKNMKVKLKDDEINFTERRIIAKEFFDTHSQILLYGNTAAITTYREPMVTTIIEHEAIVSTFKIMFEYIWQNSYKETQMFLKEFEK